MLPFHFPIFHFFFVILLVCWAASKNVLQTDTFFVESLRYLWILHRNTKFTKRESKKWRQNFCVACYLGICNNNYCHYVYHAYENIEWCFTVRGQFWITIFLRSINLLGDYHRIVCKTQSSTKILEYLSMHPRWSTSYMFTQKIS